MYDRHVSSDWTDGVLWMPRFASTLRGGISSGSSAAMTLPQTARPKKLLTLLLHCLRDGWMTDMLARIGQNTPRLTGSFEYLPFCFDTARGNILRPPSGIHPPKYCSHYYYIVYVTDGWQTCLLRLDRILWVHEPRVWALSIHTAPEPNVGWNKIPQKKMSAHYEFMDFDSQFVRLSKMHVGTANWLEKGQHCQGSHILINLFSFLVWTRRAT